MVDRVWKTQYDNNGPRKAQHGTKVKKNFTGVYDKAGHLEIVENGTVNTYEEIQSHAKSVDIHTIMRRYAAGEMDVLSRVQGFYADVSNLPTSYADVLNAVNRGHALFDGLPAATRAKFGHNFDEFMIALCNGTIGEILGDPSPAGDPSPSPAIPNPSPIEKGVE